MFIIFIKINSLINVITSLSIINVVEKNSVLASDKVMA